MRTAPVRDLGSAAATSLPSRQIWVSGSATTFPWFGPQMVAIHIKDWEEGEPSDWFSEEARRFETFLFRALQSSTEWLEQLTVRSLPDVEHDVSVRLAPRDAFSVRGKLHFLGKAKPRVVLDMAEE